MPWAAIGSVFFAASVGLVIYACKECCTIVSIQTDRTVMVVWRYPLKAIRKSFSVSSIQPAQIAETKDSEGDPYYTCYFCAAYADDLAAAPTDKIAIAQSHSKDICEQTRQQFNNAVFE